MLNLFFGVWMQVNISKNCLHYRFFYEGGLMFLGGGLGLLLWYILVSLLRLIRGHQWQKHLTLILHVYFVKDLKKSCYAIKAWQKEVNFYIHSTLFHWIFFSMLYDNSAFKMLKLKMLLNFFLNFKINVIKNSFASFLNLFLARIKLH